ncbi:heat shock protein beta-9 [Heteronotia binoei]|uniref:heat shock protein beta-9 n=1 Tax=Heteronotia binoei TaxID=13085 RepID=UPI002930BA59|nr:heat shock protein beta-9 [Heteronotia binoei]
MQRSASKRGWVAPAAVPPSPVWVTGWKTAQTPEGLLDLVLEDAYAYLDALERRKGSLLLDAPTLLTLAGARLASPGGSRREGPVRLSLDLAGFSPEDVAVQLDGRKLKVTAKRETKKRAPDGCCARDYREVSREVLLPEDADLEAVACALNADGQLRIEAPRLPPTTPPERVVPIHIQREEEAVGQGKQVPNDGEEKKPEGNK